MRVVVWVRIVFDESVDTSPVHEVGADESGEGERCFDGGLCGLCDAEEQEGDKSDGNLDAQGVLAGAEKVPDPEGLLDPSEEQLDGPSSFVELGDLSGAGIEVVGQDA